MNRGEGFEKRKVGGERGRGEGFGGNSQIMPVIYMKIFPSKIFKKI